MVIMFLVNARSSLVASARQIGVSVETIGFYLEVGWKHLIASWGVF